MKLFLKICQLFILKNIYTQIILPSVYIYKTKPDRFRYGRVIVKMSFQYEIPLKRALIPSVFQSEVFPERSGMESLYKLA